MIIKTIQWNIGGGKIRKENDPVEGPYREDGMNYIEVVLKKYNPDIITLQETHTDEKIIQANILAQKLHLPHMVNDVYDTSHIEQGQGLGQAIISRFPLRDHQFHFFINPNLTMLQENGETWTTHDKGVSSCFIQIEYKLLKVATLHLVPFRKFNVDPTDITFTELRRNITDLLLPKQDQFLLQGDFNFDNDSLEALLPDILHQNVSEILQKEPTTPKGRKYDHILFRGIKLIHSEVISNVLTDHFPVYSEFEI